MSVDWKPVAEEYIGLLLNDEVDSAVQRTKELLDGGATPTEFFENCISPALQEIGRRFETLEIFLPEMVTAADVVEELNVQVIRPAIEAAGGDVEAQKSAGKVVIASVQGDLHDIGKNMVALMLQISGYEVIDLGTNVAPQEIVNVAEREGVDIIGLSSLLTSCLPYMKDVVDFLEGKGVRDQYAVIVGGAAPTEEFTASIAADAHGHNSAEAVRICDQIMAAK